MTWIGYLLLLVVLLACAMEAVELWARRANRRDMRGIVEQAFWTGYEEGLKANQQADDPRPQAADLGVGFDG